MDAKLSVLFFLGLLPVLAQKDADWDKINDNSAIIRFRRAQQEQSSRGSLLRNSAGKNICALVVGYENVDWIMHRATQRPGTLGRAGVTPAAVQILRDGFGAPLVRKLWEMTQSNRPAKDMCYFSTGSAGPITSTASVDLRSIYLIVDYLEPILEQNPNTGRGIPRGELTAVWKKSVIRLAPQLRDRCEVCLEHPGYEEKYCAPQCSTLIRALERNITPTVLGLSPGTTSKLKGIAGMR